MAEGEITEEEIQYTLTEQEKERMQHDLLDALSREEAIITEKKAANREFGTRLKSVRETIKGYRDALESGIEDRTIEVFEVADLKTWRILKRDLETKQQISERPMSADELAHYRQPGLFADGVDQTEVPHVIRRKPKAAKPDDEGDDEDPAFDDGLDGPSNVVPLRSSTRAASDADPDDDEDDGLSITDPGALAEIVSDEEKAAASEKKGRRKPKS